MNLRMTITKENLQKVLNELDTIFSGELTVPTPLFEQWCKFHNLNLDSSNRLLYFSTIYPQWLAWSVVVYDHG